MAQRIPRPEFAARFTLPDWRITTNQIEADFTAPSWSAAMMLVHAVGAEADRVQHHPDVELRYPGRVRITLTTHAARGLTELDASMAATISQFATDVQATADSARISRCDIAIDAMDIPRVLTFWRAVMGYVDEPPTRPGDPVDAIIDPLRIGPPIWFQQMDHQRSQRNRVHLDLRIPADVAERRIADALAAGGTLVTDRFARAFWVLADPEGNEVCICTWQDRDNATASTN